MLGSKNEKTVSSIFLKSGEIRKICMSPKSAETRGVMKLVDYHPASLETCWLPPVLSHFFE